MKKPIKRKKLRDWEVAERIKKVRMHLGLSPGEICGEA